MNELSRKITGIKIIYNKEGYITYKYNDKLYFKVAKLTFERFEDESFQYTYEPYYDVLDCLNIDIPGIDLTLKKEKYYRVNMTPVFISERSVPRNRVNLLEELKSEGLDFYHPFLFVLDSNKVYGGDRLTLKSETFFNNLVPPYKDEKDLYKNIPRVLKNLGARRTIEIDNVEVNDSNRYYFFKIYLQLYKKISYMYSEKKVGKNKKTISKVLLSEIRNQHVNGIITIDEAVKRTKLGSKSTYYRRIKELGID